MKEWTSPGKWLMGIFASSIVALIIYSAGIPGSFTLGDIEIPIEARSPANNSSSQSEQAAERIIFNGEPPYLSELSILDNNLYLKHDGNAFLLGGDGLSLIRYSAWTRSGGEAAIQNREDYIEFAMSEQPYIELSYKDKFYSVEVLSRLYSYRLVLRELPESTIELNRRFGVQL